MKRRFICMLLGLGFLSHVIAQENDIQQILIAVEQNNKTLKAKSAGITSEVLELKTANNMEDPALKYDFMKGSPSLAGNQTDVTLTQKFDFPSVYSARKNALSLYEKSANSEWRLKRQQILLQAKLICLELIYRNKLTAHYTLQKEKYQQVLQAFERNLSIGNGNALDVNKAKVQLLDNQANIKQNEQVIARLQTSLAQLNGAQPIVFLKSNYPELSNQTLKANNIDLQGWKDNNYALAKQQIELAKKGNLPKIEIGYHYQGILDQQFHGGLLGLSIPLWANKNKVKEATAKMQLQEANIQELQAELDTEQEQAIRSLAISREMMAQYNTLLAQFDNGKLLDKAFQIGQITAVEYFLESNYYHNLSLKYLEFELEGHKAEAVLTRGAL